MNFCHCLPSVCLATLLILSVPVCPGIQTDVDSVNVAAVGSRHEMSRVFIVNQNPVVVNLHLTVVMQLGQSQPGFANMSLRQTSMFAVFVRFGFMIIDTNFLHCWNGVSNNF